MALRKWGTSCWRLGILGIVMQGRVLGMLVKRFGEKHIASAGFVTSSIGSASLCLAANTPSVIATTGALSLGSGMVRPAVTSLITRKAGRHEQGLILGITQSLQSIAQIISPPVATALIGMGLLNAWALLAGAFMLLGFFLSLRTAE